MKLPKELQTKKNGSKQWNVLNIFEIFKNNYIHFSKKSIPDKRDYVDLFVSRVNIENNRAYYFYKLLKEKFDKFISDLGFKCLRCERGCCELVRVNDKLSSGMVEEDFIQLRKNKIDMKGCIDLIDNEIRNNTRGFYAKELKIMKDDAKNLTRCYYYDSNKRSCKIYDNRPLFCYLFPLSPYTVQLDCPGLLKIFPFKSKKEREHIINRDLSKNRLYWEFKIASSLYITKKATLLYSKRNF